MAKITKFFQIATAGPTIDRRHISDQELQEMADSYDRSEFHSLIWYEHSRYLGNYGGVYELKTEKDEKGRLCLFAKLTPNKYLLSLNSDGQKIFTSIEIEHDFAGTGKAYLKGLAITDSPASLGTDQLSFNQRTKSENFISAPIEVQSFELEDEPSVFARMFGNDNKSPLDDYAMNKQDLEKIFSQLDDHSKALAVIATNVDSFTSKDKNTEKEDVPETVSKKEFDELSSKFTALNEKFSEALTEERPSTKLGDQAGGELSEAI